MAIQTFEDIVENWKSAIKSKFGNEIDTSTTSVAYMYSYPLLLELYNLYMERQADKNSMNIYQAQGTDLDDLLGNFSFIRKTTSKSRLQWVTNNSLPGTVVGLNNLIVKNLDGIEFINIESGVVNSSGYMSILMESTTTGENTNVTANSCTEIVTPLLGINDGANPDNAYGGQDTETDNEFLSRFLMYPVGENMWNSQGLKTKLLKIKGVSSVYVEENDSSTIIGDLGPHSMQIVVFGGSDKEIAETIYEQTPPDTTKIGTVEIIVLDANNNERKIYFNRPISTIIEFTLNYKGVGDRDYLNNLLLEYINDSPVGGTITALRAINYIGKYINLNDFEYIDIAFKRTTEINYSTHLTLNPTEKAYGDV